MRYRGNLMFIGSFTAPSNSVGLSRAAFPTIFAK